MLVQLSMRPSVDAFACYRTLRLRLYISGNVRITLINEERHVGIASVGGFLS